MEYLDEKDLDEMDLIGLLDFVGWRNSYKEMMTSYEDIVAEAEFREECRREENQLRYLEEKESK
jgi:hypothetical protein